MAKELLIIFVKNPFLGRAKTRLAKTIGNNAALEAYKRLLQRTFAITHELKCDKVVYYDQFVDRNDVWPNDIYEKDVQAEGHLGEKMADAFGKAFDQGYEKVCIIGSDCYDLSSEIIDEAFDALKDNQGVIGPSVDGGYYLLGLAQPCVEVFHNKAWSTDSVCADTEEDFRALSYKLKKLVTLNDVDVEADLGDWADDLVKTKF